IVMGWMGAGKIVQVQGVLWDIVNLFPSPVDPYLAIPVATSLAQWLRDEWEEAPVQEEEAQDEPVQAGVDTQQRDPVKPDRKPDEASWLGEGQFFDQRRLFYFSQTSANEPSKILCKALAVALLRDQTRDPPPDLLGASGEGWTEWVFTHLSSLLQGMEPSTNYAFYDA